MRQWTNDELTVMEVSHEIPYVNTTTEAYQFGCEKGFFNFSNIETLHDQKKIKCYFGTSDYIPFKEGFDTIFQNNKLLSSLAIRSDHPQILDDLVCSIQDNKPQLEYINLKHDNRLFPYNFSAMVVQTLPHIIGPQNKTLKCLRLGNCQIYDDGIQAIANALREDTTLSSLSVRKNAFGITGFRAIADSLSVNRHLTSLLACWGSYAANDAESHENGDYFTRAIQDNYVITTLSIGISSQRNLDTSLSMLLTRNRNFFIAAVDKFNAKASMTYEELNTIKAHLSSEEPWVAEYILQLPKNVKQDLMEYMNIGMQSTLFAINPNLVKSSFELINSFMKPIDRARLYEYSPGVENYYGDILKTSNEKVTALLEKDGGKAKRFIALTNEEIEAQISNIKLPENFPKFSTSDLVALGERSCDTLEFILNSPRAGLFFTKNAETFRGLYNAIEPEIGIAQIKRMQKMVDIIPKSIDSYPKLFLEAIRTKPYKDGLGFKLFDEDFNQFIDREKQRAMKPKNAKPRSFVEFSNVPRTGDIEGVGH
jgi:hypothetical protein